MPLQAPLVRFYATKTQWAPSRERKKTSRWCLKSCGPSRLDQLGEVMLSHGPDERRLRPLVPLSFSNITKSRVHPFTILQALAVYRSGKGVKGSKTWVATPQVLDVLDETFYKAFKNVEPTNKRILIALDVSGSMTSPMNDSPLSVREASSALAMVTLATEPNCNIVGFTAGASARTWVTGRWAMGHAITPLAISARQRLDDVVKYTQGLPFSGTDVALPFIWAKEENNQYDRS